MKTLTTLLAAIIFLFTAFAKAQSPQTCNCKEDLAFINEQIKEMTSFKKQMKGDELVKYTTFYAQLYEEASINSPVTECFGMLNELLSLVKDKHAHIRNIKFSITSENIKSEEVINKLRKSEVFINLPRTNDNLDEIRSRLSKAPIKSLEGIYDRKGQMTVGIQKKGDQYEGIVLESKTSIWEPGQIIYNITPNGTDMYDVRTSQIPGGKLLFVSGLLYSNGSLWHLNKLNRFTMGDVAVDQVDWEFKQLTEDTQYLYIGTFSNADDNVAAFKTFYEETKNKFTAKNIVVDLRENGGGNSKYSDPFYKIIKKKKMNVYVITNFWSGSNAEQFTLKLKSLKNAIHLGQRTYGALAYGSNYGKLIKTPSEFFAIYPTDMNFHKFINYEYVGVVPEIKLSFEDDWIDQTLNIIESKKRTHN